MTEKLSKVFEDAEEEYWQITKVRSRLESWKFQFKEEYSDARVAMVIDEVSCIRSAKHSCERNRDELVTDNFGSMHFQFECPLSCGPIPYP